MSVSYLDLVIYLSSYYLKNSVSLVISNSSSSCVMFLSSKCGRFSSFSLQKLMQNNYLRSALSLSTTVKVPFSFFNATIVDFSFDLNRT